MTPIASVICVNVHWHLEIYGLNMKKRMCFVALLIMMGGASARIGIAAAFVQDKGADSELRERALAAPAAHLAQGYLYRRYELLLERMAQSGATVVLVAPEGRKETITRDNADAYRKNTEAMLRMYGDVIQKRGFQQIGGPYAMRADLACAQFGFSDGAVTIRQSEYRLDLDIKYTFGPLRIEGVIVENGVAIASPSSGDAYLIGTASGNRIELHVGNCSVVLTKAP